MPLKTELERVSLEISRRASWRTTVTVHSDTARTVPVDYSGYTGECRIWRHPYEQSPVCVMTVANGRIASASPAGGGAWAIDLPQPRVAASLEDGTEYQVRFTAASGTSVDELFRGTITARG